MISSIQRSQGMVTLLVYETRLVVTALSVGYAVLWWSMAPHTLLSANM